MEQKFKYPFIKAISKPFADITDHFKIFVGFSSMAAFALTLSAYLFGQTFLCGVSSLYPQITCAQNTILYIPYFILKFLILSIFLKTWYDGIYLNKQINKTYLKQNVLTFLKFFGGLILFVALNMLPILSLYLLLIRIPNPVWQAEIGYFTFVSIGFIVPFVMLRFYANLGLLIEGGQYKNFKMIIENTKYQSAKILLSFAFVVLFLLVCFVSAVGTLRTHISGNIYIYNLFSEFVYEWVSVFISTLLINFIHTQREIFAPL